MHQIKEEWLMFHIMYVTQLFFWGHMTRFAKVRQHFSLVFGILRLGHTRGCQSMPYVNVAETEKD